MAHAYNMINSNKAFAHLYLRCPKNGVVVSVSGINHKFDKAKRKKEMKHNNFLTCSNGVKCKKYMENNKTGKKRKVSKTYVYIYMHIHITNNI